MKTKNLLMTLCLLSSTSQVLAARNCDWPAVTKLESGSAISTFTHNYWEFAKANLDKSFKKELLTTGPVVGDFHFNNVSAYYNKESKRVELAIIDMDDSGEGSYLADYLKFIVYLVEKELSYDDKKTVEAYIAGLKSQSFDMSKMPSQISEIFKRDEAWFDKHQREFIVEGLNKKLTGLKEDKDYTALNKLPEAQQKLNEKLIKALRADVKVLDAAVKYNTSGSSAGSQRLLMAVQDKKDEKKLSILEYKQLRCGGVEKYSPYKGNLSDRFEQMKGLLQSAQFWKNAYIVNIQDTDFLLREKQFDPFLKLEISKSKKKDAQDYAEFYAYYLGYLHSKNVPANYAELVENEKKSIANNGAKFAKVYLEQLKRLTGGKK